jgi:hypothetical protein
LYRFAIDPFVVERAIDSILRQAKGVDAIIVLDDGSNDSSNLGVGATFGDWVCSLILRVFIERQHKGLRGSGKDTYSDKEFLRKQLTYDQMIFRDLRHGWNLDEFTPSFALRWPKEDAHRAALIERACVLAKRALWGEAIDDVRQASSGSARVPTAD